MKHFLIIIFFSMSFLLGEENKNYIGKKAPSISLFRLDNNKYFRSKNYLGKEILVVSFFATWCGPCMVEIPKLHELADSLDQSKFEFILINVKEKEHEVGPFVKKKGFTLTVLIDKYAVCFESFGGQIMPLTVVIDKKGMITYYHVGYKDGDEKKLAEHLKSL